MVIFVFGMQNIKNIFFLVFTITFLNSQGQHILGANLVQNPSFEEYDTCPTGSGQLYLSKNWWGVSTEYYNICYNSWELSIPLNYNGFQYPRTGVAYTGFLLHYHSFNIENKVYIETIKNKLSKSLKKNARYCLDFYISLAEETFRYLGQPNVIVNYDSIGVIFSLNSIKDTTIAILCDTCAKITKSVVGIDTSNWMKISGSVISKGDEKYLAIGKFSLMNWIPNIFGQFYIYLDDVSVCECSFDINLGPDTTLCEGESIILNPNLPNATYTWQDSSHAATYEVKQPGTYWVRAYVADYDVYSSDTIIITQGDENFCNPPLTIPNVITPNGDGANDNFVIQNAESYNITLQIYNRWGRMIYENTNYQNDFSCKTCAAGVYYYIIKAKSKRNGRAKEYKGSLTIVSG